MRGHEKNQRPRTLGEHLLGAVCFLVMLGVGYSLIAMVTS